MSTESRQEARDRLMGEGRWTAFAARRKELQEQGKLEEEAHRLALEEFPPLKPEQAPPPDLDVGAVAGDKREALAEAAWWAANAGKSDRAPSPLAAKFQVLADESPTTFLKGVLLPLLGKGQDADPESTERQKFIERQNQSFLDTVDQCLAELHEGQQDVQCECGTWSPREHHFCYECGRKKSEPDSGDALNDQPIHSNGTSRSQGP
jgi:hypothetical protein